MIRRLICISLFEPRITATAALTYPASGLYQQNQGQNSSSKELTHQQEKQRYPSAVPSLTWFASKDFGAAVMCKKCFKRYYTTASKNGQSGAEVAGSLDNLLNNENKAKIIERLKHVKPLVRPTKIATSPRKAAVLVPLCRINGEPSLLFMMRSLKLKNHAGEICFPGGMQDEGDMSLVHTALRETQEEIGLDPATVEIWGQASPVPSRVSIKQGHMVHPIIGYLGEVDLKKLTLNEAEVYSVFTQSLSSFLITENQRQTQFRYPPGSRSYALPVFTGGEYRIWGLTAIITHQILMVMAPELYKFKVKLRH